MPATDLPVDPQLQRKRRDQAIQENQVRAATYQAQTAALARLNQAERASNGMLPTKVVLELAGLDLDDRDLVRASRQIARDFDVPPQFVFGTTDPTQYRDPITGAPISMKKAGLFTHLFAPSAVASMLGEATAGERMDPHRDKGVRAAGVVGEVDPAVVSRWAQMVAKNLGDMDVQTGIGVAVALARNSGVSPTRFEKNMNSVRLWALAGRKPLTDQQLIEATMALTRKDRKLDTARDVAQVMAGGKKNLLEQERLTADARAAVEALHNTPEITTPGALSAGGLGAQNAEGSALRDVSAFSEFEILAFTAPDIWEEVKSVEAEVQLRDEAFQNSLIGKALDPVGKFFDQTWEWTEQGLIQLGTGIVSVPVAGLEAAGIDFKAFGKEGLEAMGAINNYAFQRIKAGDTVGDLVVEGYGLPQWMAPAFDFFVGWYVDPFVIAGKAAQFRRAGRTLVELNPSTAQRLAANILPGAGKLIDKRLEYLNGLNRARFFKHVNDIPTSRFADRLWKGLNEGTGSYFRELDRGYGLYKSRGVYDGEYMKLLRDRILFHYGKNGGAEARAAFNDGLKAHYLGWGPEGSIAATVVDARLSRMKGVSGQIFVPDEGTTVALGKGFRIDDGVFTKDAPPWQVIQETIRETGAHIPFSPELPGMGFLADIGPRRMVRVGAQSDVLTRGYARRKLGRLISINPGRAANIEDGMDEYALLHGRRWAQFTETEVRTYQSRIIESITSGKGTETQVQNIIDEMNQEGIRRAIERFGRGQVPEEDIKIITESILDPITKQNRTTQAFGVVDGKAIVQPIFESQLKNTFIVVDPVEAIRDVRQYIGMRNRFKLTFTRALRQHAPELKNLGNMDRLGVQAYDQALRAAHGYQRFWKALTVARPGYVPRVILGDENARFLATTQSFAERFFSQELGPLGRFLDSKGYFNETIRIGDEEIVLGRIGAQQYEPLAASKTREVELLADALQRGSSLEKSMKNGAVSWDVIKATGAARNKAAHLEAWTWALEKQFRNSLPGRLALESIAEGKDIQTTKRILLDWAREDKYVTLRTRIGRDIDEADDWADQTARMAHGYTLGKPELADAALVADRDTLRNMLDGVKTKQRPDIHGPSIAAGMTVEGSVMTDFTNGMYNWFVRKPEDVLNRQPFYKTWKRRAEAGYWKVLKDQGVNVTPEIRQAVDVASRDFALGQVKRIMFDFTRQSRFTELLQFVFPFPQPFFEGFQAWSHIAWRNPEAIGRAMTLFRLGKESGFIRKDPVTDEWVVGMGVYAAAARRLSLLPDDLPALNFVAPLASFNMLASSTMKIGSNGILGKIAGGMPIPVPGMNPPLQLLAQQMFKDTTNESLVSYLFQYGPNTKLMPATVERVLNTFIPGIIQTGREESYTLQVLERWQQLGLDRDEDGNYIDKTELALMAQEAALDLIRTQGLLAMFSPASLRAQFGTEELKGEWGELLENNEYEDARSIWDERHPDLSLIPIANTFYTDPEETIAQHHPVQAGYEGAAAPRVPASPFTAQMMNTPGVGEFMRNNPSWAALILVGVDPESLEGQDFSAFSMQVADKLVAYKDPMRFIEEGRDALAWREVENFYRDVWTPGLDKIERADLDTQDDEYQRLVQDRETEFLSIAQQFPDFADRYFQSHEDENENIIGYGWADGSESKPMDVILRDARRIAALPGMENAPGFKALNDYLDLRDEVQEKMTENGNRYLDEVDAKGPWNAYEKGVQDILLEQPAMAPFLESYFGIRFDETGNLISTDDLMGTVATDRQRARQGVDPEVLDAVDAFDTRIERLRTNAFEAVGAELSFEQSELYLKAQRAMDTEDPKLVKQWWKGQAQSYKQEYIQGLATKPPEFYSRHDWSLVGVDLTSKASHWFLEIADARVQIAKQEQNAPGTYSESEGFEQIDAWVKQRLGKDASFDKAVEKLNRWDFPIQVLGYNRGDTKTAKTWAELADAFQAIQSVADQREWLGVNYGGEEEKNDYGAMQTIIAGWVESEDRPPGFLRQWAALKADYGGHLIGEVFLPDNYFGQLGVVSD